MTLNSLPIQEHLRKIFQWEIKLLLKTYINSLAPGKFERYFRYVPVIFKRILLTDGWGISCEIALIWVSQNFTDDQSTLVQVMAWCCQATSHYRSQCWSRSLSPYGVTRPQWVDLSRQGDLFMHWWNGSRLVHMMTCHLSGTKTLPELSIAQCQLDPQEQISASRCSRITFWEIASRDQSMYAPSQWEMSLHCNDISHWLGAYLDWSLIFWKIFSCLPWRAGQHLASQWAPCWASISRGHESHQANCQVTCSSSYGAEIWINHSFIDT